MGKLRPMGLPRDWPPRLRSFFKLPASVPGHQGVYAWLIRMVRAVLMIPVIPIELTKPLPCAEHVLGTLVNLVLLAPLASRACKPLLRMPGPGLSNSRDLRQGLKCLTLESHLVILLLLDSERGKTGLPVNSFSPMKPNFLSKLC